MLMIKKILYTSAASFLLLITGILLPPVHVDAYAQDAVPVLRISGTDRYETAAAVSSEGWIESRCILLSAGEGENRFADALAGSPLSYALNAPVLLTATDYLCKSTQDEILRLKAQKAIILGGNSVVSDNVENTLRHMGMETERLWGDDRNLTALKIAERLKDIKPFSKVFLTSAEEFQYAMMIAPYASRNSMPVLFTQKDALNFSVSESLARWGISEVHIIGNYDVISLQVEESLKELNMNVSRISGTDMGDTNVKVINTYKMDASHIAVARNDVFADGLAGAAFAAVKNMPILLTGPNSAPPPVSGFISGCALERAYILGGPGAVSDYIITLIRKGDPYSAVWGNTCGSINSGGLAAEKDGWVYYHNAVQGGRLYKARADGTEKTEICSDIAANINVIEDRIYYTNLSDGSKIYMIRADGTRRLKVCDDEAWNVTVVDNWIYYINESDGGSICKIASDGSCKAWLNDCSSRYMNVGYDNIYYVNAGDRTLGSIPLNSSLKYHVPENIYPSGINACGGWIYFSNAHENNSLYAISYDFISIKKISDDPAFDIQVSRDTIYYSNAGDNHKLYKIKTDGTGRARVYDGSAYLICITGDMIYFFKDREAEKLYKIRLDGTGLSEVD